jgi:lycopene cyclase CruA
MSLDARDLVREAGGAELLERLEHLDAVSRTPRRGEREMILAPSKGDAFDADVAIAGGGLSLLLAPLLAARGLRVVVLDRARVGAAHREWNATELEVRALAASGAIDVPVEDLVIARYRRGICRWFRGSEHAVTGVLDCAIDAGALLASARRTAERAGVRVIDGADVIGLAASPHGARIAYRSEDAKRVVTVRAVVDARGAASPSATSDLVCPTVGGVLEGVPEGDGPDRIDPSTGEILVTTEDVEDGRQHLWEAFPGRARETTVYLFYYTGRDAPRAASLVALYARFFATLPRYKSGAPKLVRPTFGLIPGWSRLAPAPRSSAARVVLVGDAAARHSPLTFCGFNAAVRALHDDVDAIERAANGAPSKPRVDAVIHGLTGALALVMARPSASPRDAGVINDLLEAAFGTLASMGDAPFGALMRDAMSARDFATFLRSTSTKRPGVYRDAMRALGPLASARWALSLARGVARDA